MFNISDQHEGYQSIYLFPFTMLTSTFGYSYSLQNFFPSQESNKTFFYSRLLKGCLNKNYPASSMDHFLLQRRRSIVRFLKKTMRFARKLRHSSMTLKARNFYLLMKKKSFTSVKFYKP